MRFVLARQMRKIKKSSVVHVDFPLCKKLSNPEGIIGKDSMDKLKIRRRHRMVISLLGVELIA